MKFVNEAIEDVFKAKTDPETQELWARKTGKDYIYRVYSGLDAFEIKTSSTPVYVPYIDIIARTVQDAREQVALLLGQKLEDQDTNPDYENYVSDNVKKLRPF
jgi:ligand-binding sensor protein